MMRLYRASALVLTFLAACSEPTASTRDDPPSDQKPAQDFIIVAPNSTRQIIANVESDVRPLPSVRVYNRSAEHPIAGTTVLFTVLNADGSTAKTFSVLTSSDGVATLPSWHVGPVGHYMASAYVVGSNSVDFMAYVRGEVVAIYDLIAFEGADFPSAYVNEGHYVLFQDGSYNHVYNQPVNENTVFSNVYGTYTKDSAGVIAFYSDPMYTSFFGSLFSEGRPYNNGKLRVTYTDFLDYDTEIYVAR